MINFKEVIRLNDAVVSDREQPIQILANLSSKYNLVNNRGNYVLNLHFIRDRTLFFDHFELLLFSCSIHNAYDALK